MPACKSIETGRVHDIRFLVLFVCVAEVCDTHPPMSHMGDGALVWRNERNEIFECAHELRPLDFLTRRARKRSVGKHPTDLKPAEIKPWFDVFIPLRRHSGQRNWTGRTDLDR